MEPGNIQPINLPALIVEKTLEEAPEPPPKRPADMARPNRKIQTRALLGVSLICSLGVIYLMLPTLEGHITPTATAQSTEVFAQRSFLSSEISVNDLGNGHRYDFEGPSTQVAANTIETMPMREEFSPYVRQDIAPVQQLIKTIETPHYDLPPLPMRKPEGLQRRSKANAVPKPEARNGRETEAAVLEVGEDTAEESAELVGGSPSSDRNDVTAELLSGLEKAVGNRGILESEPRNLVPGDAFISHRTAEPRDLVPDSAISPPVPVVALADTLDEQVPVLSMADYSALQIPPAPIVAANPEPAQLPPAPAPVENSGPAAGQPLAAAGDPRIIAMLTGQSNLSLERAVESAAPRHTIKVAVVMSAAGLHVSRTRRAIEELPSAVTFAFAPIGPSTGELARLAREDGHRVLVEIPMEPKNYPHNDPGPLTLLRSSSAEENITRLNAALDIAPFADGISTYQGAGFSYDRGAVRPLLAAYSAKGGMIFENQPTAKSNLGEISNALGIRYAQGNAVIDRRRSALAIREALAKIEREALQNGSAIAIASVYNESITALREWIGGLEAKGIMLVPVTDIAGG